MENQTDFFSFLKLVAIGIPVAGITLLGCHSYQDSVTKKEEVKTFHLKTILVTVDDMTSLDGCGFVFRKEGDAILVPVEMPDSLKRNHLKLYIRYTEVNGMSSCMAGKLVKVNYAEYVPH